MLAPEGQEPNYCGNPAIPDAGDLAALFEEAYDKGWQVLRHANGDAAADQMFDVMRPAHASHPAQDRRHVMVHGQLIRSE